MSPSVRASVHAMITVAILAITGLGAGAASAQEQVPPPPAAGAPFVYVTANGGATILRVSTSTGGTECIYQDEGASFEDIVIGPDGLLYACDTVRGTITRLDPAGEISEGCLRSQEDVQLVFASETVHPRSPWFTHRGDLVFTDAAGNAEGGSAVRRCTSVAQEPFEAGTAAVCSAAENLDSLGFAGEGLTQAANGDLLAVAQPPPQIEEAFPAAQNDGGAVWRLPMDQESGEFTTTPEEVITGLQRPIGIARLSTGEVFVADFDGEEGVLERYVEGAEGGFEGSVCATFDGQLPHYLEATADDTLYVATTGGQGDGQLWSIAYDREEGTCQATPIIPSQEESYVPALVGVAVPPTSLAKTKGIDGERFFVYGDHAFGVNAQQGTGCAATITAVETPPACIDRLKNLFGEDFSVVPYLGEKGFATTYVVEQNGQCTPPSDAGFELIVSAFTQGLENPRIARIDGEYPDLCGVDEESLSPDDVNLIELSKFFPFNGFLPDDGYVGGFNPRFSTYFAVDAALLAPGADGAGSFCGLEQPLDNVDDPDLPAPSFKVGSTVPLKFHVAELEADGSFNCGKGPFVTDADVLLSIARIRDDAGNDVFDIIHVQASGHYQDDPVAIFTTPGGPGSPYHFNWNTSGLEPGLYQLVLVARTSNFPVQVRYVELAATKKKR